jgi:hypothetical protein
VAQKARDPHCNDEANHIQQPASRSCCASSPGCLSRSCYQPSAATAVLLTSQDTPQEKPPIVLCCCTGSRHSSPSRIQQHVDHPAFRRDLPPEQQQRNRRPIVEKLDNQQLTTVTVIVTVNVGCAPHPRIAQGGPSTSWRQPTTCHHNKCMNGCTI